MHCSLYPLVDALVTFRRTMAERLANEFIAASGRGVFVRMRDDFTAWQRMLCSTDFKEAIRWRRFLERP